MKKLYRFYTDIGRGGEIEGTFVREEEDVKNIIGCNVHFGEILGKHSDVSFVVVDIEFTELTDDQEFIKKAEEYGIIPSGHNPFDYIDESDLKEHIEENKWDTEEDKVIEAIKQSGEDVIKSLYSKYMDADHMENINILEDAAKGAVALGAFDFDYVDWFNVGEWLKAEIEIEEKS